MVQQQTGVATTALRVVAGKPGGPNPDRLEEAATGVTLPEAAAAEAVGVTKAAAR